MNETDTIPTRHARHYAEAFSPTPGRCFRLIHRPDGEGQPMLCPEQPAWRGRFRAPNHRTYTVDACSGHASPLTDRRPAPSKPKR